MGVYMLVAATDGTAELRGWLTVAWALVVGAGTLAGVTVAVSNYLDNSWDRRVKVARLVHCSVSQKQSVAEGERKPSIHPMGSPDRRMGMASFDRSQGTHGLVRYVAKEALYGFAFELFNGSDETIDEVEIVVLGEDGEPAGDAPYQATSQPLKPGVEQTWEIWVRSPSDANVPDRLRLAFRDSAGNRWHRIETDPPRLYTKRPRKDQRAERTPIQHDPYMT